MNDWRCTCGATSKDDKMMCWHCGEEREFCMSASQARAVARKLNRLERERDEAENWASIFNGEVEDLAKKLAEKQKEAKTLSAMLAASTLSVARPHQKQSRGHERRFVVGTDEDMNWCALCGLESVKAHLREHHAVERWIEGATDETV